jgi:hypothetical protein
LDNQGSIFDVFCFVTSKRALKEALGTFNSIIFCHSLRSFTQFMHPFVSMCEFSKQSYVFSELCSAFEIQYFRNWNVNRGSRRSPSQRRYLWSLWSEVITDKHCVVDPWFVLYLSGKKLYWEFRERLTVICTMFNYF